MKIPDCHHCKLPTLQWQETSHFSFIFGGFSCIRQGTFDLIRAKWNNNFLSGFWRGWSTSGRAHFSPHLTLLITLSVTLVPCSPPLPGQPPHFLLHLGSCLESLSCQSSSAALIMMLLMSSGRLCLPWSLLLSSLCCLCFNYAALGRYKGMVWILLLHSSVYSPSVCLRCTLTGTVICHVCLMLQSGLPEVTHLQNYSSMSLTDRGDKWVTWTKQVFLCVFT